MYVLYEIEYINVLKTSRGFRTTEEVKLKESFQTNRNYQKNMLGRALVSHFYTKKTSTSQKGSFRSKVV